MFAAENDSPTGSKTRRLLTFGIVALFLTIVVTFIAMGLFTKLFRGQTTKTESSTTDHREDWAAYMSTIDGDKVGAILVDLGLKTIVPIKSKDHRLRVNIALNEPSSNGLPSSEEHLLLGSISEQLVQQLRKAGGVFAGHLFCDGTLSLYFYIDANAEYRRPIASVFENYANYKHEEQVDKEPGWQTYADLLYPLPVQMQSIHNQKVIDQLRREGDKLEKKRPVDHMIYFKTENDTDKFLAEIDGKGFKVVTRERTGHDEYPWTLLLRRDDPVDPKSVDEYVLYLWQKAQDSNGDYDGWGSTIVRE